MADALVQLILRARDEATVKLRAVSGEVGALSKTVNKLSGSFGLAGLGVSGLVAAGASIFAIAKAYGAAVEEAAKAGSTMGQTRAEFARSKAAVEEMNYQLALLGKHLKEIGRGDWAVGVTAGTTAFVNSLSKLKGIQVLDLIGKAFTNPAAIGAEFFTQTQGGKGVLWDKEKIPHEITDEEKARAKRLKEIQDLLGVGKTAAEQYAAALDRIETGKKWQTMIDALQEAGALWKQTHPEQLMIALASGVQGPEEAPPNLQRRGAGTGIEGVPPGWLKQADFDLAAHNRQLHDWLETMPKISAAAAALRAAWKDATASLYSDSARLAAGGLNDAFRAWEYGAAGAADRIRNVFRNVLDDIAADAVRLGLGALLSAAGLVIGGPVGAFVGAVGGQLAGGNSLSPSRERSGAGMNVTIHTSLTAPDAFSQLTAHDSPLRRAVDRQIQLKRAGQDG